MTKLTATFNIYLSGFIILIVVFVAILIFLQRRGKLTQAKQKAAAEISHIRKTIKREAAGYNVR